MALLLLLVYEITDLAGSHDAPFFFRWATRKAIEKMGSSSADEPPIRQ